MSVQSNKELPLWEYERYVEISMLDSLN
jgi:hypothetical protein